MPVCVCVWHDRDAHSAQRPFVCVVMLLIVDGAGGVKQLKAADLLVPVGCRKTQERQRSAKGKGPADSKERPDFTVPVSRSASNKFTEEQG